MRYQAYPPLGTKTNRFITYDPDDPRSYEYRHESGTLSPVNGAIHEENFNSRKYILPHLPGFIFDACEDYETYRRNSYRGRRRCHALQLAANYRQETVCIFEKGLDNESLRGFQTIVNQLRALVQGVRVTFKSSRGEFYYQISKPLMETIYRELESIRQRTVQINKDRAEDILQLPTWGDTSLSDVYSGVYTKNDWEILAATFRFEVETFLLAMIYLNYDFQPIEIEDDTDEEPEEDCAPFKPQPLSSEVTRLLEESMRILSQDHVVLEDSPEPPVGPSSSQSVRWKDPTAPSSEDLNVKQPRSSSRQGELVILPSSESGIKPDGKFTLTRNLRNSPVYTYAR